MFPQFSTSVSVTEARVPSRKLPASSATFLWSAVNYLQVFRLQRNKYSEQSAGWKLRGLYLGREQVFIIFSKRSKTDCLVTQLRIQYLLPFFPGDKSQGRKFYYSYFSSLARDVIVSYAFMVRTVTLLYFTLYYLQLKYLSATAWSPVALMQHHIPE